MCGSGDTKAPWLGPYAKQAENQAGVAYGLSSEQQDWARNQWNEQQSLMNDALATQTGIMKDQYGQAGINQARYDQYGRPLEDALFREAASYGTEERKQMEAARQAAMVRQATDAQRQNAQRNLEAYGIDPSQTRAQSLDLSARVSAAAMEAGAMNTGRQQAEQTARDLRGQGIALGQGLGNASMAQYGMAGQAGSGALANKNATVMTGANTMGTGMQWQGQGLGATQQAANIRTQGFNNKLAGQGEGALGGIGQLIGTGAGIYGGMGFPGMEDGGHVTPHGPTTPEGEGPQPPGPTDTVPAMLAPGEYVIPADVVRRKGIDFFDNLVKKTQGVDPAKSPKDDVPVRGYQYGGPVQNNAFAPQFTPESAYAVPYQASAPVMAAPRSPQQGEQMPSAGEMAKTGRQIGQAIKAKQASDAYYASEAPLTNIETMGANVNAMGNAAQAPMTGAQSMNMLATPTTAAAPAAATAAPTAAGAGTAGAGAAGTGAAAGAGTAGAGAAGLGAAAVAAPVAAAIGAGVLYSRPETQEFIKTNAKSSMKNPGKAAGKAIASGAKDMGSAISDIADFSPQGMVKKVVQDTIIKKGKKALKKIT